jgi:uncharacterized protein YigE (DUF2233 family)
MNFKIIIVCSFLGTAFFGRVADAFGQWHIMNHRNSGPLFSAQLANGEQEVQIEVFLCRSHHTRFKVLSNMDRQIDSVREAVESKQALAGVNGGFFHEDGTPLGLLISQGHTIHRLEHSKLLSGVFMVKKSKPSIIRSSQFRKTQGITEAIQAGPFLIENGKIIPGLNTGRRAARTFIFQCDATHWAIGICRSTTLAETAKLLRTPGLFPSGPVTAALNFDGGSSTQFFATASNQKLDVSAWSVVSDYLLILNK